MVWAGMGRAFLTPACGKLYSADVYAGAYMYYLTAWKVIQR